MRHPRAGRGGRQPPARTGRPGGPSGPVPQVVAVRITNIRAVSQASVLLRDASQLRGCHNDVVDRAADESSRTRRRSARPRVTGERRESREGVRAGKFGTLRL